MIKTQGNIQSAVLFGYGDIGQASSKAIIDGKDAAVIAYYQLETPQAIGTPTKDSKPIKDIICAAPVVFIFTNIESLDIAIKNLRTLKRQWLKEQAEPGQESE
jgi:hypothetical protein